jgi:hypothetical protein
MKHNPVNPPSQFGQSRRPKARLSLRNRSERLSMFAIFWMSIVALSVISASVLLMFVFLSRSFSCSTSADESLPAAFACMLPPVPTSPATKLPAPTVVPTVLPKPTPTPTLVPSQTPTPTKPPITITPDRNIVQQKVTDYVTRVIAGNLLFAYDFTSSDFQSSVPYDVFTRNKNYVLWKACWRVANSYPSQRNSQTWDVGVELTQTSCVDGSVIATFLWHFQLQEQEGLFAITSIALYPTGVGNS